MYRYRNRAPYTRLISYGIFWYFITLLIESSIIPIEDVIFEHRVYLPSAGAFMAIVTAVFAVRQHYRTTVGKYIILTVYLMQPWLVVMCAYGILLTAGAFWKVHGPRR